MSRSQASARCRCTAGSRGISLDARPSSATAARAWPSASRLAPASKCDGPKAGIETRRGAELDERVGVPSALLQHDAEVVSDEGAVTAVPNDGAERRFGRVEPTRRQRRDAFGKTRGQRRRQILRLR